MILTNEVEPLKVTMISSDDGWTGIYFNGCLCEQDHKNAAAINWFCEAIGFNIDWFTVDEEWLESVGEYPLLLSSVKFAK